MAAESPNDGPTNRRWRTRTDGVDRTIAALAERQHGVVGRRQLLAAGISVERVDGRVRRGQLHPVHPGVYAVGHRSLARAGHWQAALLLGRDPAALSHRTAACLWRILPGPERPVELTRARGWRAPPGVRQHTGLLPEDEVCRLDGMRVTTVSRTIVDLAGCIGDRWLEQALNQAEVLGLTDHVSIPEILDRQPGRRGAARLRRLLGDAALVGITRSGLEDRFVAFVDAAGLPRPQLNATIAVSGRFFEVDCVWRQQRLIVELDGRAAHATRYAFEADRERDRLLLVAGWRVARVTWRALETAAAALEAELSALLKAPPPTLSA